MCQRAGPFRSPPVVRRRDRRRADGMRAGRMADGVPSSRGRRESRSVGTRPLRGPSARRPLEQRRTSGGKARNTAFPNAALFSQTMIIFHGGVMPNWPRPPVQERSFGTSEDSTSWEASSALRLADYACRFQRHRQELRTRKFRAFPPLVLRCSSGRADQRTLSGASGRNGRDQRHPPQRYISRRPTAGHDLFGQKIATFGGRLPTEL